MIFARISICREDSCKGLFGCWWIFGRIANPDRMAELRRLRGNQLGAAMLRMKGEGERIKLLKPKTNRLCPECRIKGPRVMQTV